MDKVQELRSGILTYTSLVLLQMIELSKICFDNKFQNKIREESVLVDNLFALCGLRRKGVGGCSTVEAWKSKVIERVYLFKIHF